MALTTSARMGGLWRAAKLLTASHERRTAKFLSWLASFRNIPKFITARRSKRYDSCKWAANGYTDGFSRERRRPMKQYKDHPIYGVAVPSPKKGWYRGPLYKSAVRQRSRFYFSIRPGPARKKKTARQKNITQRLAFRESRKGQVIRRHNGNYRGLLRRHLLINPILARTRGRRDY